MVTIREATDAGAVRRWVDAEFDKQDAQPWTTAKVTFTAERDGALIGAAIGGCVAGVGHLGDLIVGEGERDRGVGAQLLAAFEAWAWVRGAHKCTLNTQAGRPAVHFYERHGWRVSAVQENHYQGRTYLQMMKEPPPVP